MEDTRTFLVQRRTRGTSGDSLANGECVTRKVRISMGLNSTAHPFSREGVWTGCVNGWFALSFVSETDLMDPEGNKTERDVVVLVVTSLDKYRQNQCGKNA